MELFEDEQFAIEQVQLRLAEIVAKTSTFSTGRDKPS